MRGKVHVSIAVGLSAVVAVAVGAWGAPATDGAHRQGTSGASCAFDPAKGILSLQGARTPTRIVRSGDRILFVIRGRTISCGATAPTVNNVDSITVVSNGEFGIDLRNGQFAPGRTAEADGSSEIEIQGMFRDTGGARVRGTVHADRVQLGEVGGHRAINLDAREPSPDADVVITGGFIVVSVIGRGGSDRIKATGGRGFDGPLEAPIAVSAGAGNDRVVGSERRDLIGGGAGNDRVDARAGRDRVRTQGGADRLRLRDRTHDRASCGHGRDHVTADRLDQLKGCES